MKKLALICHSHHKKSQAFDYVYDILCKWFKCERYWDGEWEGGVAVSTDEINAFDPDIIVFGQIFPKHQLLRKIKCKNTVWLPMFDSEIGKPESKYRSLLVDKVKIFSFSRELYRTLNRFGMDVVYGQLFPPPGKVLNKNNKKLKVFYWPRVDAISWDVVKMLLGEDFAGEVIIQNVPDPKNSFILPSSEDIKKYQIQFIDYWMEFNEAMEIRAKCDVFIAPRLYEGIGLTFLEAMASGVAVISPNNSTMNEYIENGYNGYLYDINHPSKIDLSNISVVKNNAHKTNLDGYSKWLTELSRVKDISERSYISRAGILKHLLAFLYVKSADIKSKLLGK